MTNYRKTLQFKWAMLNGNASTATDVQCEKFADQQENELISAQCHVGRSAKAIPSVNCRDYSFISNA